MDTLGQPLRPMVAVAGLSSPLEVGADQAPALAHGLGALLADQGFAVVPLGSIDAPPEARAAGRLCAEQHVDAIACVSASWFEDYLVIDMLEEHTVPVLLWSTPGMETGALCGSQQLTSYLKQLEWPYGCVFGAIENSECLGLALGYLLAAGLKSRLRRARIGFAGQRVAGMTHTAPNEFALKKAIGPRVVPLDVPMLLERAAEFTPEQTMPLWRELVGRAAANRVPDEDGLDSMSVYLALREIVAQESLDALTVGCYPHLMGRVCIAGSLLADEGIPMACEGDVNGAVAQLMLQLFTGWPTHCTDWLNPLEDGTVIFTHCGSGSFSLAERQSDITLAHVRLMDQGVCALFPALPGPVTLMSLIGLGGGYQCALLEGEALPTEMVFPGNPVRVQFSRPVAELIDWVHAEGIGHHWMIGYGHVAAGVRHWAAMAGQAVRLVEG